MNETAIAGMGLVIALAACSSIQSPPDETNDQGATGTLVPWVTSASDDLVSRPAVTVTGSAFTAALASKTVTTFVGK